MSTSILPTLKGLTYPAQRSTIFNNRRQQSIGGKTTRVALWSTPRYQWVLSYSILRQGIVGAASFTEMQQMEAFFEKMLGGFDSFLYQDPDDNTVTDQPIGTGNGSNHNFQLVRSFGGQSIPILAPNLVASVTVKVNGTPIAPSGFSITPWGTADTNGPGVIEFVSAPAGAAAVTASYSYYFPCCFDDDHMDFGLFSKRMYELQKVSFTSIK